MNSSLQLLICLLLMHAGNASSQGIIQWENTIGGSEFDELYSLQQTTDGGYILGGWSVSNISGDKTEDSVGFEDYWVIKLDASGNIQWQNTIGGNSSDWLLSIQQTMDGGYIAGGFSYSDSLGDKTENNLGDTLPLTNDYWVIKLDISGDIEWQNTIGGNGIDELNFIQQTADSGYILGGSSKSGSSGDKTENNIDTTLSTSDYWIVKLGSKGNVLWENTIGGSDNDYLHAIQQTTDGGYILGGISQSNISGDKTENTLGAGDLDYWVIKLDASGTIQWQNTIGGTGGDVLLSVQQTTDGGYILGGVASSPVSGDKTENSFGGDDYWIIKLDASGDIQWQNTIGGNDSDFLWSVQQTADEGYIAGGYSRSDSSGDKTENTSGFTDYWVVKLDSSGTIQWENTLGGTGDEVLKSIQQTADNGYILGGYSNSTASDDKAEDRLGYYDYWVVKLYPDNVTYIRNITGNYGESVRLYPNPSSEFATLDYSSLSEKVYSISIINMLGERVTSYPPLPSKKLHFQTSTLSAGAFIIELTTERGMIYKKLVVR